MTNSYGSSITLNSNYEDAIVQVTAALKEEGFGVLTEIDVKATMKKKLDVDMKKYIILGACNPPLAYKGLTAEKELGLLLPCNVIVYEIEEETTAVSFIDPKAMLSVVPNSALDEIATEVSARFGRVMAALS